MENQKTAFSFFATSSRIEANTYLPTPGPPRRKHHSVEVMGPHPPSTKDVQVQAMEDALVRATLFEDEDIEPDPQIPRQDHGLGAKPSQGGHSRVVIQVPFPCHNDGWAETRDTKATSRKPSDLKNPFIHIITGCHPCAARAVISDRQYPPPACKPREKTSQDETTPKTLSMHQPQPHGTPKRETIGQAKDLLHGTFAPLALRC